MKRKKYVSLSKQNARAGYLFSLPFIIGFVIFFLFPVIQSAIISFQTVFVTDAGMQMPFVGLQNYNKLLFEDPTYLRELLASIQNLVINFPAILLFSFFIAVIINQKFRGRTLARVIFFLPVIVSSGVIMLVQNDHLQSVVAGSISEEAASGDAGVAQILNIVMNLVRTIRLSPELIAFITGTVERVYLITISSGIQILIFLAGLQTISPSLYEASSIEGATGWENFWKITFPIVSPLILVNAVYTIVDNLSGLSNNLIYRIYEQSFFYANYGFGSAMGWVYFLTIIGILTLFLFVTSKLVYYEND